MRLGITIKYIISLLFILSYFIINNSLVMGARVAGEKGTVSAAPEYVQKVRISAKPSETNPKEEHLLQKNIRSDKKPVLKEISPEKITEKTFSIDFNDVDIATFIKFVSEQTGKNFIIDKGVKGKVTIISPTEISKKELYRVFESVLEVYGYATVPAGSITKIIPAVIAKSKNIETRLRQQATSMEDKVVTQLIPLKYANPLDLKKLFSPLVSKSSLIVPYAPTGTLIVTDVLSNINRLIKIIKEIDVEGIGEEISLISLEYATASVLAKSLNSVFQKTGIKRMKKSIEGGIIKITSDDRTNSLIILASENDTHKIIRLTKLLDTEIPRGEGDIHVYYLQNANAEDLASVLKAIPSDKENKAKRGKAPVVSKDIQIVADKATNSLVINSNKSDYLILENVIKKLDIPRRMVYIEALIMEVSITKNFDIGVEWEAGKDIGSHNSKNVGGFIGSRASNSILPSDPLSFPSGLTMGVLGEAIQIGNVFFPNIGAIIQAYKGDSDVHILSTPQIMTTDNEEAEIMVADNIPFLTRKDTTDSGTDYSNYEFKDVGTTLTITPQINQERFVRLKISQEVSQVVDQQEVGLPTTLKRQAKTTVIVKDGNTVVIGGLIDETLSQGSSNVPFLGSIPILGLLFKSSSTSADKTNLYIFITPHIIENPQEAHKVYEGKKEQIESIRKKTIKMYEK